MPALSTLFRKRLRPAEVLLILAFLGAVAGGGWVGWDWLQGALVRREAAAAWPAVLRRAQDQCDTICAAVDAYHAALRAWPPDHRLPGPAPAVDPSTNQLLAELSGASRDPASGRFRVRGMDSMEAKDLQALFGTNALLNTVEAPAEARPFLASREGMVHRELHDDPDIYGMQFGAPPDDLSLDAWGEYTVTPWLYVSSSPAHNPGRFDLWMEIDLPSAGLHAVVGNWNAARPAPR